MITIEVQANNVLAEFNRLLQLGANPHEMLNSIGQTLETRTTNRFESATDPNGAAWAQWQPSTVKSYPKNGLGFLLRRTGPKGDMFDSLGHQVVGNSVLVGFGQPYAQHHEFGTKKMARRGMLMSNPVTGELGAGDEQAIIEVLRDVLKG